MDGTNLPLIKAGARTWTPEQIAALRADHDSADLRDIDIAERYGLKLCTFQSKRFKKMLGLGPRRRGPGKGFASGNTLKQSDIDRGSFNAKAVRDLYQAAVEQEMALADIAQAAGQQPQVISSWRTRSFPLLDSLERAAGVVGLEVRLMPPGGLRGMLLALRAPTKEMIDAATASPLVSRNAAAEAWRLMVDCLLAGPMGKR